MLLIHRHQFKPQIVRAGALRRIGFKGEASSGPNTVSLEVNWCLVEEHVAQNFSAGRAQRQSIAPKIRN